MWKKQKRVGSRTLPEITRRDCDQDLLYQFPHLDLCDDIKDPTNPPAPPYEGFELRWKFQFSGMISNPRLRLEMFPLSGSSSWHLIVHPLIIKSAGKEKTHTHTHKQKRKT